MLQGESTSTTRPSTATSPARVTSVDPGTRGSPHSANQPDPNRAISARWAIVSTLLTTVGRPFTPDAAAGSARRRGRSRALAG